MAMATTVPAERLWLGETGSGRGEGTMEGQMGFVHGGIVNWAMKYMFLRFGEERRFLKEK